MILAIETSTPVCSVVLQNHDGQRFERRSETHGSHSENLFLFINDLMKKHSFEITDLDAVLISEGPGSYTGLRIAASAIKGLLFNKDVPLYGVNTLASFAVAANNKYPDAAKIHSIIDAKRKHLYLESFSFEKENLIALNSVKTRPIEEIEQMLQPGEVVIGTGIERLSDHALEHCHILNKNLISANSLFECYHSKLNAFANKADIKKFEPKYYTSNQVSSQHDK